MTLSAGVTSEAKGCPPAAVASVPTRNEPDSEELNYPYLFDELESRPPHQGTIAEDPEVFGRGRDRGRLFGHLPVVRF